MIGGPEYRSGLSTQHKNPTYWIDEYLQKLSENGWRYITSPQEGKINPSIVAAQDEGTTELLSKWRESKEPVEVNMVLVMPNSKVIDLPARSLGYLGTTLSLAALIREKGGINVSAIRVLSPCYWNVYADGGDLIRQLQNGAKVEKLAKVYKENYYPELDQTEITVDTGKPITPEVETSLLPRVLSIQRGQASIAEDLLKVAIRHDTNGVAHHLIDEEMRPLAYLLAHPPAWGHSLEPGLFDGGIPRKVNLVPASELRYLAYIAMTRDTAWVPNPDAQIATLISGKQTHAPYYPLRLAGMDKDVTLRDLAEPGALQIYKNTLRNQSGRIEVAETIANLNQLNSDMEQARRKARSKPVSHVMPLHEIIRETLGEELSSDN